MPLCGIVQAVPLSKLIKIDFLDLKNKVLAKTVRLCYNDLECIVMPF